MITTDDEKAYTAAVQATRYEDDVLKMTSLFFHARNVYEAEGKALAIARKLFPGEEFYDYGVVVNEASSDDDPEDDFHWEGS